MVIRGRDCAANSWVKDAARANDGARVMDAERAGCWSSQPKNSADADLEKPALRAQISASRPKPVTILGMGVPTRHATMVNGRPFGLFRQPLGERRSLP